jgi:N-acetylmuramoyl-L-alanine amidase
MRASVLLPALRQEGCPPDVVRPAHHEARRPFGALSGAGRGLETVARLARGLVGLALVTLPPAAIAAPPLIVDYQDHLNSRFVKRPRTATRFIVIHSTECGLESALRTLSRGKVRRGRYITCGGHANYLVARNGTIYRLLDPRYRADHAGTSMWNGVENLSNVSLGIELEGFHDRPFSTSQYRSLRWLLGVLRRRYHVESRDVLEHCRVAYAPPNRFHARAWRGRKLDPGLANFVRRRAGLESEYALDPDVVAGRLGGERAVERRRQAVQAASATFTPKRIRAATITPTRSAWSIAGPSYRSPTTLYLFPDGTARRGDRIRGWDEIPAGTEVYLDVREATPQVVSVERTAWSIAGGDYDAATTLYLFPDGSARRGDEIADWSSLPDGTRVHVGVPDQPD